MTPKEFRVLGFAFILVTVLYILSLTLVVGFSFSLISSIIFGLFSVYIVHNSINTNRKTTLIFATIIFCVSLYIFIVKYFHIINISQLLLPFIFFSLGVIFLMLFILRTENKIYLLNSLFLFLVLAAILYFKNTLVINKINLVLLNFLDINSLIIIIIILLLIFSKNRRN